MYKILFETGPLRGNDLMIRAGETTIGRGFGNAVKIPDINLSRSHATLEISLAGITLRDLGTTNGTYLNGLRVGTASVHPGDRISLGESTFLLINPWNFENPPPRPTTVVDDDPASVVRSVVVADISIIAQAQRMLVFAMIFALARAAEPLLCLFNVPFSLWVVFRLTRAMRFPRPFVLLVVLALFLPVVDFVCLVLLHGKARALLLRSGLKVGFFGLRRGELGKAGPTA
ncbi:MAG: hypothetical protein A2284_02135 [Deltaproteobacteria bacterium RIFOXYA12_FULL_61_11]|nr:MAG: hypothetical protein A2284_02135 [Deltaproteobacteria bacterium RIFOXYA12_FULL_61_11]